MARERYLLNAEEETIHGEKIPETPKSKRQAWWEYNRRIILLVGIVLVIAGFTVYNFVTTVRPDYNIALLTKYLFSSEALSDFGEHISEYGEDLNGDGKVVAYVSAFNFSTLSTAVQDSPSLQASMVRFTADVSTGESMIFLHDEESFDFINSTETGGLWRYNSGETMPEDATDFENAMISFDSFAAFNGYSPPELADGEISSEEVRAMFSEFRVSRRSIENSGVKDKADVQEYFKDCDILYGRLLTGEKAPRQEAE